MLNKSVTALSVFVSVYIQIRLKICLTFASNVLDTAINESELKSDNFSGIHLNKTQKSLNLFFVLMFLALYRKQRLGKGSTL